MLPFTRQHRENREASNLHHCRVAYMVEIKTPAGVLSDAQRAVATAVLAAGGHFGVARDADEALACLDAWGIPRARVSIARRCWPA